MVFSLTTQLTLFFTTQKKWKNERICCFRVHKRGKRFFLKETPTLVVVFGVGKRLKNEDARKKRAKERERKGGDVERDTWERGQRERGEKMKIYKKGN